MVNFSHPLVTSPFHWSLLPNTAEDSSLPALEPVLFHKNKRRAILLLFLPRQKNRFPETASKTEDQKGNTKKTHRSTSNTHSHTHFSQPVPSDSGGWLNRFTQRVYNRDVWLHLKVHIIDRNGRREKKRNPHSARIFDRRSTADPTGPREKIKRQLLGQAATCRRETFATRHRGATEKPVIVPTPPTMAAQNKGVGRG